MGHCCSKDSVIKDENTPGSTVQNHHPQPPPRRSPKPRAPSPAVNGGARSNTTTPSHSFTGSPWGQTYPAGVPPTPSPARTPRRMFKWPFPPPSPAKKEEPPSKPDSSLFRRVFGFIHHFSGEPPPLMIYHLILTSKPASNTHHHHLQPHIAATNHLRPNRRFFKHPSNTLSFSIQTPSQVISFLFKPHCVADLNRSCVLKTDLNGSWDECLPRFVCFHGFWVLI